jgi:dihydroflavonol-4-reductase
LGHDVHILARSSSDLSDLPKDKLTIHIGDVTSLNSLKKALKDMEAVFHLAGVVGYSRAQRSLMEQVNVEGTSNVIAACIHNSVERLIYMSSVVAVGASLDGKEPLTENSVYNMKSFDLGYFETKRIAELNVLRAYEDDGLDCVILNPSTIYGPGDAKKGSRGVQLKVAKGKFPFYTSGGVSIVSINDVVDAMIKAWRVGRSGERYILCGENISIKQLFELIANEAGVEPRRSSCQISLSKLLANLVT